MPLCTPSSARISSEILHPPLETMFISERLHKDIYWPSRTIQPILVRFFYAMRRIYYLILFQRACPRVVFFFFSRCYYYLASSVGINKIEDKRMRKKRGKGGRGPRKKEVPRANRSPPPPPFLFISALPSSSSARYRTHDLDDSLVLSSC